jgi:aminomethyltransferase
MGYVEAAHSALGTKVDLMVRGKALPATIVDMPFVPHRYHRS